MQEKYEQIIKPVVPLLKKIEDFLHGVLKSEIHLLPEVGKYIIDGGGKRIRPVLTCFSGILANAPESFTIRSGAVVELLHTGSLIHDDVVDIADKRRGRPSANVVWGNKISVLAGDFLLTQASRIALDLDSREAMQTLLNVVLKMVEGEAIQLTNTSIKKFTEETYMEIITRKTAYLMACACELPAIGGGVNSARRKALRDFGLNFGIAFQISDDALDYDADEKISGKKVGKDIEEHKITLPLVIAYKRAGGRERAMIDEFMMGSSGSFHEGQVKEIVDLVLKLGGAEESRKIAHRYALKALEDISEFRHDFPEIYSSIEELCEFVVKREQ